MITVEYNGKNYLGWQINGENNTIGLQVESAVNRAIGQDIKVVASGRTDAGVHAYCQVCHLDLPKSCKLSVKNLIKTVNNFLPSDIRIIKAKEVSDKFHARYNVKSKTYLYKCYTSAISSPLKEGFYAHYPAVINIELIKKAAKIIEGKHDFSAFCLTKTDSSSFEREVYSIDVVRRGDELLFYVKGNGFLYSMVRLIVGTLLFVGQGKISLEQLEKAINEQNKQFVGEKMPACGLYLFNVEY